MDKRIEIFAVGKWNGMNFSMADLHGIVEAFDKLGANHKVPLKFGHNDEQPFTDGQPAIGWVKSLSVEGDKLIAEVTDIPDIVMSAMNNKLYRNVSVELDMDVSYKDTHYPLVLSGIALLGADIPAVNTLKDLTHFLGRDANFSVGSQKVFSAIAGKRVKEFTKMDNQEQMREVTTAINKLTADVALLSAGKATAEAENILLKAKVAQFEAERQGKEDAVTKNKIEAKRDEVAKILEFAVKSDVITPAQRSMFERLIRVESDEAMVELDMDTVKKFAASGKKPYYGDQGRVKVDGEADVSNAPMAVSIGIKDILAKKEAVDFAAAQQLYFMRNPKIARDYINFNN